VTVSPNDIGALRSQLLDRFIQVVDRHLCFGPKYLSPCAVSQLENFQRAAVQALATPRSIIDPWLRASHLGRAGLTR
jgi:hypothetical protein